MMLTPRDGPAESTSSLAGLKKLNRSFVLLCRFTSLERTKTSPFACLGVLLARIKPQLPGCKFTDHKKLRFVFSFYYRDNFTDSSHSCFAASSSCASIDQVFGRHW